MSLRRLRVEIGNSGQFAFKRIEEENLAGRRVPIFVAYFSLGSVMEAS